MSDQPTDERVERRITRDVIAKLIGDEGVRHNCHLDLSGMEFSTSAFVGTFDVTIMLVDIGTKARLVITLPPSTAHKLRTELNRLNL